MAITRRIFGNLPDSGDAVYEFTFDDGKGSTLRVISLGGIITSICVPDKNGHLADVALGFDSLAPYLAKHPHFGAITGRVAGRIAFGKFAIDGKDYQLVLNEDGGVNHIHGGVIGFSKKNWKGEIIEQAGGEALRLTYTSPDGEEGYPGTLQVAITYWFRDGVLGMESEVSTDKATPVCITNHSYFNLAGSGDILDHEVQIFADECFLCENEYRSPSLERIAVEGTASDLRTPQILRNVLPGIFQEHGDVYFISANPPAELKKVAIVCEPTTGRKMEVSTNEPCLQFYSGSRMDGSISGKTWNPYNRFSGICLECQGYSGATGHPEICDLILRPGQTLRRETRYAFFAQ